MDASSDDARNDREQVANGAPPGTPTGAGARSLHRAAYAAIAAIAVLVFVADAVLPRGATAAIGYCLIPVVAAGVGRRGFLACATVLCSVLTAAGYFLEPPGAFWWMSVFDRLMVIGVLWLTFALVKRRAALVRSLVAQSEALGNAARELRRSNDELESFASVVAHDLRGPLNTVGLLAAVLSGHGSVKAEAECVECITSIRAELSRMSGFIQQLLSYGHAGASGLHLTDCDVAAVLADVRRRLRADLERNGATVTGESLPVVYADPVLLGELFQNLVENSLKYRSAAPPRIHISAVYKAGAWLFSVRDNGVGIRAEDCDQIFAPFRQIRGDGPAAGLATALIGGGVGLGLATCKRIVERHGGRIGVRSKPGEGTTFTFTIPAEPSGDALGFGPGRSGDLVANAARVN
jgi:signal transduction histidine kinase